MKTAYKIILGVLIPFIFVSGQENAAARFRGAVLEGNRVKTVFGNWGVIGQPAAGMMPRGAWLRKNNGYLGDESVLIGVEFPVADHNNDGKMDTVHSVITSPVSRPLQSVDQSPTGDLWTFMPAAGSYNAVSDRAVLRSVPSTWPPSWPAWKEIPGIGPLPGAEQAYLRLTDSSDHRFDTPANNPYAANISGTAGQGISVEAWYVQMPHPIFRDVLFRVYDVANGSGNTYQKMFFGYLAGTYVGLTGNSSSGMEYDDDYTVLLKEHGIVLTGDADGSAARNPYWSGPVGMMGAAFTDAPEAESVGSFEHFSPSNAVPLGDDEALWRRFLPGRYRQTAAVENDTTVQYGQDGDYTMGTRHFSLAPGQTRRIASVLVYGWDKQDVAAKTALARALYRRNLSTAAPSLLSWSFPSHYQTLSGTVPLQWHAALAGGSVGLYYSRGRGERFRIIAEGLPVSGTLQWNTAAVPDAPFGMLAAVVYDSSGRPADYATTPLFRVLNTGGGAPQAFFDGEPFAEGSTVSAPVLHVPLLAGAAPNDSVRIDVSYRTGGPAVPFKTFVVLPDSTPLQLPLDLSSLPNAPSMSLRFIVTSAGGTDTLVTESFVKATPRTVLPPANIAFPSRRSGAGIDVVLVDKASAGTDLYRVTFSDTAANGSKTYSVRNMTTQSDVVKEAPLFSGIESAPFAGMRLSVNDVTTEADSTRWSSGSGRFVLWTRESIDITGNGNVQQGYAHPSDYRVEFMAGTADTTLLDTPPKPVSYRVRNLSTTTYADIISDQSVPGAVMQFFLRETVLGVPRFTWSVTIQTASSAIAAGETLYVTTAKGVSFYDTLSISGVALSVPPGEHSVPNRFALSQNYPNPFNPSTTISYALPQDGLTTLKVYDVLGREVTELVNEFKTTGQYTASFDASRLSSGVYVYRLVSDKYSAVKKMLMLR